MNMEWDTLITRSENSIFYIKMNCPETNNSLNYPLVTELNHVFDLLQENDEIKMVVLEGCNGKFCTGMDFNVIVQNDAQNASEKSLTQMYMELLRKLSLLNKVVIAKVEGQVLAGGVGLCVACDFCYATESSQFSLSEILWGLLPSMVIPYLIRKVGYKDAYQMSLTTMLYGAAKAKECGLVDEVTEDIDREIRKLVQRVSRLQCWAIQNCKEYFRSTWMIDEEMEQRAVQKTSSLVSDPRVRQNIENYVKYKKFPWNK